MNAIVKQPTPAENMDAVLIEGNLSDLAPAQRVDYYNAVCKSLGLNPLTKPFAYVNLNGKLQLYALRACADQLRKIHSVSLEIVSRQLAHDVLTVHVRARLPDGRSDEDFGSVPFPDALKGEARANAELKAVTKAKRRATLSICGLGWLDETEVEDIPTAKRDDPPAPTPPMAIERASGIVEADGPPPPPGKTAAQENPLDWIQFGQRTIAECTSTPNEIEAIKDVNSVMFQMMEEQAPKVYARMMKAIDKLKPATQPMPADDPEAYLKWLKENCAACAEITDLREFARTQAEAIAAAFPPDREQCNYIINEREKELESAGDSGS